MRRWLLIAALLLAACSPIRGCVESEFTLAPDSRLPKWASIPATYSRGDVTVKLTYYVPPFPVDNAVIEFEDRNRKTLAGTTGEMCWHPIMEKEKNQHGGFDPESYPHYVYIRANGVVEVVEHIQGPIFRITDDPALTKTAKDARRCDKG